MKETISNSIVTNMKSRKKMPLWRIVLTVIFGALLVGTVIYVLYSFGFFE